MKPALRALLVLLAAAVVTQAGAAAPARMHLVTAPFSYVMWNEHDGLLGIGRCDAANDARAGTCVSGAVERTSDGGRTYQIVLRTKRSIDWLRTVGARGAIATTVAGQTFQTFDRGRTWRRVPSQPVAYWLTSRIGVTFRSYSVRNHEELALRVTHDGGHRWRQLRNPCERTVAFSASADLVTPKLWWLVCLGQPAVGSEDKAVYRTRDGGRTWEAGASTVLMGRQGRPRGGIGEYGYPEGLAFAPDGFGLLTESRGTLYVSRDGGVSWQGRPHLARPDLDFAAGAAVFRGGVGYVLLNDDFRGRLIETHDAGRTWRVVRRWR